MSETRAGELTSAQISKIGVIDNLDSRNFQLSNGNSFNIKNDGSNAVVLEVQLSGMEDGDFIETRFDFGWNPEIVKAVKQTSLPNLNLKWGY